MEPTPENKIKIFAYACANCDNDFERDQKIEDHISMRCRECGEYGCINEKIEYWEKDEYYELYPHRKPKPERWITCPICNNKFQVSAHLEDAIKDEKANWLANMVTHYRHNHITSWDNTWGRGGYGWNKLGEDTYEEQKTIVNERAKRQILRKCKAYMIEQGFTVDHVKMLQGNDPKTFQLYEKVLGKQV